MITTENRRESFNLTIPHITNRKAIILQYLNRKSMTPSELANQLFADGIIPMPFRSYVAPRLTELADEGRVSVCGYRFCTQTQRNEAVYSTKDKYEQGRLAI
jgi:hypothetical protein